MTTVDKFHICRRVTQLAEELHLEVSFVDSAMVFVPDVIHYPGYAVGAKLGFCHTVEEAYGFLKGFCQACEYFKLGKQKK